MAKGGAPRASEEWLQQYAARNSRGIVSVAPAAPKKPAKYRNEKETRGGITFDSRDEAVRWGQLKLLEKAGQIRDLQRQVPFILAPPVWLDGKKKPALRYFADATYFENGLLVVEDTKSKATRKNAAYRIKKHLMRSIFGIEIREVGKI